MSETVRRPLAEGDRLVSNPCAVTVIEVNEGSAVAQGRCHICRTGHILDRKMFDAGRGPWRRLDGEHGGVS